MQTLQLLGDPRWIEPLCTAPARDRDLGWEKGPIRCTPAVLAEVRRLDAGVLAAQWNLNAAELVPDLVAALQDAGPQAAAALLRIGHDDHAAVRYWRARAAGGDLRAALAVRRLTGDTEVVLDAVRAILAGSAGVDDVPDLGDLGGTLLSVAAGYLTGEADLDCSRRTKQVLAARVAASAENVLPTLRAILRAGHAPARHACDLAADLANRALEPELRQRLRDPSCRLAAARALARLGVPTAELAEPLVQALSTYDGVLAPQVILELRVVEAIPGLEEFLAREERVTSESVWHDEHLLDLVSDAVEKLRAPGPAA